MTSIASHTTSGWVSSYCVLLLWVMGQSSCQIATCGVSKEAFLQRHQSLLEEAKKQKFGVDDPAWNKYDERFVALTEGCYDHFESKLNAQEKRRFWTSSLTYYVQRYGAAAFRQSSHSDIAMSDQMRRGLKRAVEETGMQWQDLANRSLGEIEGLLQGLEGELEKFLDRMKELFKD